MNKPWIAVVVALWGILSLAPAACAIAKPSAQTVGQEGGQLVEVPAGGAAF